MMKASIPKVSIGMPVYNGETFISEALDSLLAQTFADFELIISDNASTDATQSICEKYASCDPRIKYMGQTHNKGALANFQFVLDQSQGEFFMWAAADDLWDKGWIETVYAHIKSCKHVAGFAQLVHIDAHSKATLHVANHAKLQFEGVPLQRKLSFYLTYEGKGKANLFYALYPRKVLQGIDLSRFQFDYQILFSLLERVEFMQVEGVCLYKRIHGECGGGVVENVWRSPAVLAPARVLWRDLHIATHYLKHDRLWLRLILAALIPIKLLVAVSFHAIRFGRSWLNVHGSKL
jgi:glycosyltransferase involved in cell wall biosynthesis